jgi:hypothetical protein
MRVLPHLATQLQPEETTTMTDNFDLIHEYSRKQAIADGILIDVSLTAKEAGIKHPTALTCTVWGQFVQVPEGVEAQDEPGRLWDLLRMLRGAIEHCPGSDTVYFYLHVRHDNQTVKRHLLKAVCGPGDDGEPVITVMIPTED